MQEVARDTRIIDDAVADQFKTAHAVTAASPVQNDTLADLLADSGEEVTIEQVVATDNPGRPKSILMGDMTVTTDDGTTPYAFEVLCVENNVLPENAGSVNDDGSITYTVDELAAADTTYRYTTLELVYYEV